MGNQLARKIDDSLKRVRWPENPAATELGRESYMVGLDQVDAYRDDPRVLADAVRALQSGDSRPYALAGAAYVLVAAARQRDGAYDPDGLAAALAWLEQAQECEPEIVDINVVEAFIYIHGGRLEDARLVLDYLQEQDPYSYLLQVAELTYWQQLGDLGQIEHWFQSASDAARTVPQRLRLLSHMGDTYLALNRLEEALTKYKEAVHFDADNHWLWHKISTIHWRQEAYEEANRANQRALKLADFPEGRQLEEALQEKLGGPGVLGRLFSR